MRNWTNYILVILFFSISNLSFADTGFGPSNRIEFRFLKNNKSNPTIDSIAILTTNRSFSSDTLFLHKKTHGRMHNWVSNYSHSNLYFMDGRVKILKFKIILFLDNKPYESTEINIIGDRKFFTFSIEENGTIVDRSPLFYARWSDYFKALFLTIFLELLIALLFFKPLGKNLRRFILVQLICNLVTHPILWYLGSNTNFSFLLMEEIVALIETLALVLIFRKQASWWVVSILVLLANFISWSLGGIIMYIIASH